MTAWRLGDTDWNSWPGGLSDAQTWQQAATLRLDGVELGVYDAGVELSDERLGRLERLAAAHDVPVLGVLLSLTAGRWPGGALSADPAGLDRLHAQVRACARACSELGLDVLGVWPGADPVDAPVLEGLRRVAAAAGDVRIALEYKPGTAVATAEEALELCRQVPGTGVLLDTGHAYANGEDPALLVELLGDRLLHLHLGDAADGGADDDLPCGRLHDFGALVSALDASGFTGAACFDLYGAVTGGVASGRDAVRESRDHVLSRRT